MDGIKSSLYISVDNVTKIVTVLGKGALVNSQDRPLQAVGWKGEIYVCSHLAYAQP